MAKETKSQTVKSGPSHSATIKPREITAQKPIRQFAVPEDIMKGTITSKDISEKIAESRVLFRSWKNDGLKAAFPHERRLWTTEKYYPDAKGGPLYIDEPQGTQEVAECERKREVMKKLGHRYLVIRVGTDLFAAMQQLGLAHGVDNVA